MDNEEFSAKIVERFCQSFCEATDKNVIIQSKLLENIINLTNIMLIYMKKVE